MGFGSSIVLLVLLDEGQVVEDGGEHRMRFPVDLPGLGDAGSSPASETVARLRTVLRIGWAGLSSVPIGFPD
jgi:hypothetical protein